MECKHINAFRYSSNKDDYEGRLYDENYCPECGEFFETRVYVGKHEYPENSFTKLFPQKQ